VLARLQGEMEEPTAGARVAVPSAVGRGALLAGAAARPSELAQGHQESGPASAAPGERELPPSVEAQGVRVAAPPSVVPEGGGLEAAPHTVVGEGALRQGLTPLQVAVQRGAACRE
jgi:hypothetical protein